MNDNRDPVDQPADERPLNVARRARAALKALNQPSHPWVNGSMLVVTLLFLLGLAISDHYHLHLERAIALAACFLVLAGYCVEAFLYRGKRSRLRVFLELVLVIGVATVFIYAALH